MKQIFSAFLFICCTLVACAQHSDYKYVRNHFDKTEVYIEVRDGVKLFTARAPDGTFTQTLRYWTR